MIRFFLRSTPFRLIKKTVRYLLKSGAVNTSKGKFRLADIFNNVIFEEKLLDFSLGTDSLIRVKENLGKQTSLMLTITK